MSARNLLRHVFRHRLQERVSEDALPLGLKQTPAEVVGIDLNNEHEARTRANKERSTLNTSTFSRKTPEPFGLGGIAEELVVDTPSSTETASSLAERIDPLDLEINTFSTRELVQATLDEAKTAAVSHLETIDTTLALLGALDGLSTTISVLKEEMLAKKQACEDKMVLLETVERAVEGMVFAGEAQQLDVVYHNQL
ncbi:hypothetical protein OPT61_g5612 [Boeremia exigua]|uniref:Uncharacterized protein n=1 Tax=Boeremia exigua TaxID=749465 RepID=A0ACC2I9P4_9PLEO|nr:hypothetical protein OPT61_g5612 [Boeremia exigua]